MTIQTRIHDGIQLQTRTYRGIISGVSLAQLREGFYAQGAYNKWGQMVQLKGNERILLAVFGLPDLDVEPLNMLVEAQS